MEIKAFIDGLVENVFTDTPRQLIDEETEYMELDEWSSMVAFSLISYIEETYGKKILLPELLQAQTIGNLFQVVTD